MFWTDEEWDEAYQHAESSNPDFSQLSGMEQVRQLIAYLMQRYPVSREQLQEAKHKYAR